jgi:hypothetical protein
MKDLLRYHHSNEERIDEVANMQEIYYYIYYYISTTFKLYEDNTTSCFFQINMQLFRKRIVFGTKKQSPVN